ncbi:MAG: hypothetical protein GX591_18380, partial [Planctomycetes bacterium]|nr:hypothetical protein [Planctomycetota bacterium]
VLAVALVGTQRRMPFGGMSYERQCAMKAGWEGCAEVVLAGDSRVGVGLSPAAMAEGLPSCMRILNCGFGAVTFTEDYLNYVERVLRPKPDQGYIIVLGISPLTLTEAHAEMNSFISARQTAAGARWTDRYLGAWAERLILFCQPIRRLDEFRFIGEAPEVDRLSREVLPDGWNAHEPRFDSYGPTLERYREMFAGHGVCEEAIGRLVSAVRRWTAAGIRVYAFRPPAPAEMIALENDLGGFDEPALVARLTGAGAVWIAVDPAAYRTHDSCHLGRDEALRLSREIAGAIAGRPGMGE